jgi:hypothetical protein
LWSCCIYHNNGKSLPKSHFGIYLPRIYRKKSHTRAEEALSNIEFKVATAKKHHEDKDFDFTFLDCLHDMGDPVGARTYLKARKVSPLDGSCMIVEPLQ